VIVLQISSILSVREADRIRASILSFCRQENVLKHGYGRISSCWRTYGDLIISQKPIAKRPLEITDKQVADAELLIRNYCPEVKLGPEFREDLKDALTLMRRCYESVLKANPGSQPGRRRNLETLRGAMTAVARSLGKEEIKQQIADFASLPSSPASNIEEAYGDWSEEQLKRKDICNKIDQLNDALLDIRMIIDQGLARLKFRHAGAIPRQKTEAIAAAAGAFLGQVEHLGIPTALWHHGETPSRAASIIAGAFRILGIKASERAITALRSQLDHDFQVPILVVPARASGKRR